jgi:hypothetical protein
LGWGGKVHFKKSQDQAHAKYEATAILIPSRNADKGILAEEKHISEQL